MENYIDSMNYSEILSSAADQLEYTNGETLQFLLEIKRQLEATSNQLAAMYARRADTYADSDIFEYKNPDELPDFHDVPEDVADKNYKAWDKFYQAIDTYGDDTRILLDVINHVSRAMDKIGELE